MCRATVWKQKRVQFERFGSNNPIAIPGVGTFEGVKTSVFPLEVEGAAHYLPRLCPSNLDIMTFGVALATGGEDRHCASARSEWRPDVQS